MQGLIICILILAIVSPTLCMRNFHFSKMEYGARSDDKSDDLDGRKLNKTKTIFNVMDHGARGDGKNDDSEAFLTAWQHTCGAKEASILLIPAQKTFLVKKLNLEGPCKAETVTIQLQGKIVAPAKTAWGDDKTNWLVVSYINGLTIDAQQGTIDGYGSTWWQCKPCSRPTSLRFHGCNNLNVIGLTMINSPGAHIAINGCHHAKFSKMNVQAPGRSPNTDGFDISSSTNINIQDSIIATGDDCIAINGGSSHINATRIACGPGHGISIGSLGKGNSHEIVEQIYVQNCSFKGTTNGARIKTWPGGSGYARNITFDQITLTDVRNPIIIDQYYGDPNSTANGAVKVSDVIFSGFRGTSADAKAIDLNCWKSGCSNIVLDRINIVSSQKGVNTYASYKNVLGTIRSTVIGKNPNP